LDTRQPVVAQIGERHLAEIAGRFADPALVVRERDDAVPREPGGDVRISRFGAGAVEQDHGRVTSALVGSVRPGRNEERAAQRDSAALKMNGFRPDSAVGTNRRAGTAAKAARAQTQAPADSFQPRRRHPLPLGNEMITETFYGYDKEPKCTLE